MPDIEKLTSWSRASGDKGIRPLTAETSEEPGSSRLLSLEKRAKTVYPNSENRNAAPLSSSVRTCEVSKRIIHPAEGFDEAMYLDEHRVRVWHSHEVDRRRMGVHAAPRTL